jgi:hypothetical protein
MGGTALAAREITGSDSPETVLQLRVAKHGKLIGTHNDGTVKQAGVGVGVYEITPFLTNASFDVAAIC